MAGTGARVVEGRCGARLVEGQGDAGEVVRSTIGGSGLGEHQEAMRLLREADAAGDAEAAGMLGWMLLMEG